MVIRQVTEGDMEAWVRMRVALWPEYGREALLVQAREILADAARSPVFVAEDEGGELIGFLEAGTRPFADGCETKDVGYIEGWFVEERHRRTGVGRELVEAAEAWARGMGCREMASDCHLENVTSAAAHGGLGYEQVERMIHFRKVL